MFFKGKRILVIGGTGTIGKSIIRTVMEDDPALVRVYSRDEYKQDLLLKEWGEQDRLDTVIGDVRDYVSLHRAMSGIDYVFHLAAMKQVASCEYNPYEAVKTNVIGTENVIHAALDQQVKKVVFTSSDKAISPTNAYGATKLVGERLISAAEQKKNKNSTVFASVRFGNVMGSRGSVIPLFINQILHKGKVTVTDVKMTRFMMTLKQATSLTIQALKQAEGGEVFVLKMPVIGLHDLATVLIQNICQKYKIDENEIQVEEIGLRPGEKMYEELMTYDESLMAWELPHMYVIPSTKRQRLTYAQAKKAKPGTYGSKEQTAISKSELEKLLKDANFI